MFVQPQLRHIQQFNQIGNTRFPLTLSEMTHNCSLYIMRKTDYGRNGCITADNIEQWSIDNPVEYEFLEDLFNFAPDFIDKHRAIILQAPQKSNAAGHSPSKPPNNNFEAQRKSPARQVLKPRHVERGNEKEQRNYGRGYRDEMDQQSSEVEPYYGG